MADSLEASVASLHAQSGRRRGSRTVDPQDSWGRSAQADACADDLVGTRSLRATLVEQQRKEPEFRSTIGRQQQDWEALTFRLDSAERPLGSIESSPAWAVAGRVTLALAAHGAASRQDPFWGMASRLIGTRPWPTEPASTTPSHAATSRIVGHLLRASRDRPEQDA